MNRRNFVKFLALTAAGGGSAAMPQQVAAYQRYYNANMPVGTDLVAVDEIMIGGIATHSIPATMNIRCSGELRLPFGVNLFGGVVRWVAAPDMKLLVPAQEFTWELENCSPDDFRGHISYVDQESVRHYKILTSCKGSLGLNHYG